MTTIQQPLVSVIVPCYNQARFLPDSVGSVIAQSHSDWECLIIDDGSNDDTRSVGTALAEKDARIRFIHQNNRGLAGTRNRGLAEAKGRYIQFLDADDVIMPDKWALQLEVLSQIKGLGVVSSDYNHGAANSVWDESKDREQMRVEMDPVKPLEDLTLNWETRLSVPCHCFLLDARIFKVHKVRFCEGLPNHEDWDCWMQVFALPVEYRHLPQKLAIYRLSNNSMSTQHETMRRGFLLAVQRQMRLQSSHLKELLECKRQEIEIVYRHCLPQAKLWRSLTSSPVGRLWGVVKRACVA